MSLLFPKPAKVEKKRKRPRARRHTETRMRKNHEFLYGVQAHVERRIQLFERAGGRVYVERDADGKIEQVTTEFPANCEVCAETHPLFFNEREGGEKGDWIHTEARHCDCLGCALFGCREVHSVKFHHGRRF